MAINESTRDDVVRDRAIKRLKKRRDFSTHLVVYVLVNAFIVAIWAFSNPSGSSGPSSRSRDGASVWS
jgi:hypothetical protein